MGLIAAKFARRWVLSFVAVLWLALPREGGAQFQAEEFLYGAPGPGNSSIVVYDIDPELQNGLEIFVASSDGTVSALRQNGEVLWRVGLPISRCRRLGAGVTRLFSSPAVGDLYGNGHAYLAVGYGAFATKACGGGLAILDAHTGRMHRNVNLQRLSRTMRFWAPYHTVYSTPFIADLNNDGVAEIGFGSWDRHFYLLSGATPAMQYQAADTIWSSPAVARNSTTGRGEVVLATDITGNRHMRPPTRDGGLLYSMRPPYRSLRRVGRAYKRRGRARGQFQRFGFRNRRAIRWMQETPQVLFSTPAIGELIAENPGEEIAIGSGCYFPENTNQKVGRWVRIYGLDSGMLLRELPLPACTPSSPALGDLTGDGKLNVAITVSGSSQIGGEGRSTVHVFDPETGEEVWRAIPRANGNNDAWGGQFLEIAIADINGNGANELIVANGQAVHIFDGRTGESLTCNQRECDDGRITLEASGVARTSPVIADIDGNGELELIIGGGGSRQGRVYVWRGLKEVIHSEPGPHQPFSAPWPMFKHNAQRTSNLDL